MNIQLTNEQLVRLKKHYPYAYIEYQENAGNNTIRPMLEDIISRYPTAPELPTVYRTVGAYMYRDVVDRLEGWTAVGIKDYNSIVYAYSVGELYILHYIDNIFDAGIHLSDSVIGKLVECYEQNRTVTTTKEDVVISNIVAYKFEVVDGNYFMYVNGIRVMVLSSEMLQSIRYTIEGRVYTPKDSVLKVLNNMK